MSQTRVSQKLQMIQRVLDQGGYDQALDEIRALENVADKNNLQRDRLRLLSLKAYVRKHWLPEANVLVQQLLQQLDDAGNKLAASDTEEKYCELALFYVLIGANEQAEFFFKKAIKLNKGSVVYASELGILYEQLGKKEQALKIYEKIFLRALERKKLDSATARIISRLSSIRDFTEDEMAALEKFAEFYKGDSLEASIWFSLAKAYSRRKQIDREMIALEKANRLNSQQYELVDVKQTIDMVRARKESIQKLFATAVPEWMPSYFTSDRPFIFILGMPRSGTTLLEQILGAHSNIANSGESRGMGIAMQRILRNKALLPQDVGNTQPFLRYKTLDSEDAKKIVSYYIEYQQFFSDKPSVTDKELSNIDRIGLIANMFPQAKFVSIRRHPLDVCVSILQHDFLQSHFANSSVACVQEYFEYYDKVDHWKSLYCNRFFDLEYETLVTDFERISKELIAFLGYEWEGDIQYFYERNNSVRTPSQSQVRSSINTRSVGKWKHYQALLAPAGRYLAARNYDGFR